MSGGHFDYVQNRLDNTIDEFGVVLANSEIVSKYNQDTRDLIKVGADVIRLARVMIERVDRLVSGDDSEETFKTRLAEDMEELDKTIDDIT